MTDPRRLIHAYLDGELTPDEDRALRAWLAADRGHVRIFALETFTHRQLRDLLVERGLREGAADAAAASRPAIPTARRPGSAGARGARAAWVIGIGLAGVAAGILIVVWIGRGAGPGRSEPVVERVRQPPRHVPGQIQSAFAFLDRIEGTVSLIDPGGRQATARAGAALHTGSALEVVGPGSRAAARCPDGTRLDLEGCTRIDIRPGGGPAGGESPEDGATFALARGTVVVDAVRRPAGRPLVLTTPHAEVQVVGTRFRLTCGRYATHLHVFRGAVQFVRPEGGEPARVEAGREALVESPAAVDEAVRRGVGFLVSRPLRELAADRVKAYLSVPRGNHIALVAYALACLDSPAARSARDELVQILLEEPLDATYLAALQAMALRRIDADRYAWRIAQCAQFLADTQCANGQWNYGGKTAPMPSRPPEAGAPPFEGASPPPIRRRKEGSASGDNSNLYYALLGLRASAEAGIRIDPDIVRRSIEWLRAVQNADGGWGYDRKGFATDRGSPSYGSMTAAGIASVGACRRLLGEGGRPDPALARGADWFAARFDARRNPGLNASSSRHAEFPLGYYLCAVARAAAACGADRFGPYAWYAEGANALLDAQRADGGWPAEAAYTTEIAATCYALLFLSRAERPGGPVDGK